MDPKQQLKSAEETANLLWFDALLRHQIFVIRMSGSVRNDIIELLNRTEKDIEGKIRTALAGQTQMSPGRVKRAQRLMATIRRIRNEAWDKADQVLVSSMRDFIAKEGQFLKSTLEAVVPVELTTELPAAATLKSLVSSKPFEGRVLREWARSMRRADIRRIEDAIQIGLVQGESAGAIARRVLGTKAALGRDGATQTARRNAEAVSRTAVNHFSNSARQEFIRANSDLFDTELFVATLDGRTTPVCRGYDGQKFPVADGPMPPLHFNCRSIRVAAISAEAIGTRPARPATEKMLLREFAKNQNIRGVARRADLPYGMKTKYDAFASRRLRELTGILPAKVTYNNWLRSQSAEFQNDVLGRTRAILFRRGNLPLDRFVNRAGDEIPLHQLARRERAAFRAAGLDVSDY